MNNVQAKAFHEAFAEISAECEAKEFRLPNSTDFGFGWRKAEEFYTGILERWGVVKFKCACCGKEHFTSDSEAYRCEACCWTCVKPKGSIEWVRGNKCPSTLS